MINTWKLSTSDRMPPPHPTSITLRPSSGLDEFGSLLDERICTLMKLANNQQIVHVSKAMSVYSPKSKQRSLSTDILANGAPVHHTIL
jgi:hypothetical protein